MDIDVTQKVRNSCRQFLRPIASLFLKCGMTWKEFSDLSKSVFVQAATEDFGIRGRPTNVSRVSILTGISRKEVKRQRDLLTSAEPQQITKTTDATRVLSGWYQDPDFLTDDGQPKPLTMHGPSPSFESLFRRYGGDTPEQTLLKELRNGQAISTDADGNLIAESRYYMPVMMAFENILLFMRHLCDHARTLNFNVAGGIDAQRRFERIAVEDQVDSSSAEAFKVYVDTLGQQFLEDVDDWLSCHRFDGDTKNSKPVRLGVGVYAIDGQLHRGSTQ